LTKIIMEDGTTLYSEQHILSLKSYLNSANSKGAVSLIVYKDKLLTEEVCINLTKVVYFEDASRNTPVPNITSVHQAFEGTIGTTASSFVPNKYMTHLLFLSNDGTTDLFITFDDKTVTTTPANNTNSEDGVIRLKAGEVLTDMKIIFQKINMIRSSGTGVARIVAT